MNVGEVEEVCRSVRKALKTYRERIIVLGKTKKGRLLTVVLAAEGKGKYYVVTARDMSKKERRLLMTKLKKIPKFKTIAEEARFWDTHDVTDYLPEMKEVKISFDPSAPKEETLTIRVQSSLKRRLEKIAKNYGVTLSTLLRIWFIDKLKETGF